MLPVVATLERTTRQIVAYTAVLVAISLALAPVADLGALYVAGAVPVLVGWAAVTGGLSWTPVLLFAVIFVWTPPHFWALAVRYRDDYEAASVPMLPVVATLERTTRQIVAYTAVLVAISLALASVADLGALYVAGAAVLGAVFLAMAVRLWWLAERDRATSREAMRLFGYSITYLTLLFVVMACDVLIRFH